MIIGVNLTLSGSIVLNPPPVEEPGDGLGPELSPDPEFENNGAWTDVEGAWSVNGSAVLDDPDGVEADLRAPAMHSLPAGTTVRVVTVIDSVTSGGVQARVGGAAGAVHTGPGTYTEDLVTTGIDELVGIKGTEFPSSASVASASFRAVLG